MADFQLNANIPLLARGPNSNAVIQQGLQFGQQFQQQQLQAQQQQQVLAANQAAAVQTEQNRVITSVAQGFQEISGLLDAGDFKGVADILNVRRDKLIAEGRDTRVTDEAIAGIQSGDATLINRVKIKGQAALDAATSRGLLDVTGGAGAARFSPTTTTLPGGITIQTTSAGGKRVTDAGGKVLVGQDAIDAITTAEELKAQRQIDIAGGKRAAVLEQDIELGGTAAATKKAAEAAIKLSTDAFTRLEPLRANIVNIDEAISLIDEGAKTGVIASRLPSIRSASIKLDTLQKKLGLDVISSTTFGALSEGEREFALSTALPKTLKGPELKEWLIEKKAVQEKLIDQLSEAATFLGTPGNTIADFIELKQLEAQSQEQTGGMIENSDGTFTLPDGRIVRRK